MNLNSFYFAIFAHASPCRTELPFLYETELKTGQVPKQKKMQRKFICNFRNNGRKRAKIEAGRPCSLGLLLTKIGDVGGGAVVAGPGGASGGQREAAGVAAHEGRGGAGGPVPEAVRRAGLAVAQDD